MLPEDGSAQIKQDIMKTLLLRPFGGQLQDLGVGVEKLAGIAGRCCCFHLVSSQDPNLNTSLVQRLNSVCSFVLKSVAKKKNKQLNSQSDSQINTGLSD